MSIFTGFLHILAQKRGKLTIFCAKFNGGSLANNARFADYGDLCDLAGLGRTKLH